MRLYTDIGCRVRTSRFTVQGRLAADGLIAITVDHPGMAFRSMQVQTLSGRMLAAALKEFVAQLIGQLEDES